MKQVTGAELALKALESEGTEVCFGYPGGVILPFYDKLFDSKIRHILVRHEQGAMHMAEGYARVTNRVGVVVVTSGPGATNTITGLADALMDSTPLVVITGQVNTALIGNDAFQEADIVGITRSVTKHNYLVKDARDIPRTFKEAFYLAASGRPGPIVIDLPKDVQIQVVDDMPYPKSIAVEAYNPPYDADPRVIDDAVEMLLAAESPVIYSGGGILLGDAVKELDEFVELMKAPITNTLMGLSSYSSTKKYWMGMLGMHGTYTANMAVTHSDVLIALGSRFDDRVTGKIAEFAPNAKIIHVDIDPSSISKNVKVDIEIEGHVKRVLAEFNRRLKKQKPSDKVARHRREWMDTITGWKTRFPLSYKQGKKVILPQHAIETLCRLTRGEAIITTEVGQHQMWAAQFYNFRRPFSWVTSGGLGTMGFGFPAALGAQMAFPDRLVIDIAGDASIQMTIQELATAVQYRLPVKVAILNNGFLGMVRQWQSFFYKKRYSASCMQTQPDFVKLAEAYGASGFRIEKVEDLEPTLKRAFDTEGPVLIDIKVAKEEDVFPMVPSGSPINEMLLS